MIQNQEESCSSIEILAFVCTLENSGKLPPSTGKFCLSAPMSKFKLILAGMPLYGQDSAHSQLKLAQLILALLPTVCPTD